MPPDDGGSSWKECQGLSAGHRNLKEVRKNSLYRFQWQERLPTNTSISDFWALYSWAVKETNTANDRETNTHSPSSQIACGVLPWIKKKIKPAVAQSRARNDPEISRVWRELTKASESDRQCKWRTPQARDSEAQKLPICLSKLIIRTMSFPHSTSPPGPVHFWR